MGLNYEQTKGSHIEAYDAEAVILNHTIVKLGTGEQTALPAAAATDVLVGVAKICKAQAEIGETISAQTDGVARVLLGADVAKGDYLTSDAAGMGTVAAATDHKIGIALEAGVTGDVISVQLEIA